MTVDHGGLALNGNLVLVSEHTLADGVILMLHGTLGHKDMEIMSSLQSIFAENSRNSLAINLSLEVDNRQGFFPCDRPHTHRLQDAGEELDTWLRWLELMDARKIVLLGHSRGANQIARYIVDKDPTIAAAILIAPPTAGGSTGRDGAAVMELATENEWLRDIPFLHCSNATVSRESYLSYYGPENRSSTPALLLGIELPVLVFSASDDLVVPGLAAEMTGVRNKNVVHEEIEGADHFFRDLYAYDLVDTALEFLDSRQQ